MYIHVEGTRVAIPTCQVDPTAFQKRRTETLTHPRGCEKHKGDTQMGR